MIPRIALLSLPLVASMLATPSLGQYVVGTTPPEASTTEQVDFGDIDLDGDWDVVVADGGDFGNDQNRIWVNLGGLQGGTLGEFEDQTAQRAPVISDASRDAEFADLDGDSDLDVWISNDAQITNQGDRIWINQGLAQGGTLGFFQDDTNGRFLGLGGTGSSVGAFLILPTGNFVDWSDDTDFGDLDNDGDLDVIHSSHAGAYGGQVPTRLFLNDGNGFFTEFNPSGFQLPFTNITNGDPGLWCEGTQQSETVNTTGLFCDVATVAVDVDVADIDQDLDLDILLGDRQTAPRMFANRLEGSVLAPGAGSLGFRDVTGAVFPAGYSTGTGHFEQEMGDLDGDDDVDILGVGWVVSGFAFNEVTLQNDGTGVFGNITALPNSGSDDEEGDFLDFDNDGDLDVFIGNFSGQDRLYRNVSSGGNITYEQASLPSYGATTHDIDSADVDNDGDDDVLIAEHSNQANTLLVNVTNIPDTTPPRVPLIESVAGGPAFGGTYAVRAQVYDNAPYYTTWYNDGVLEVSVDGIDLPDIPMRSSMGQIFRGEIPANLVGSVSYRARSTDPYGNAGSSTVQAYTGTGNAGSVYGQGTGATGVRALGQVHEGVPATFAGTGGAPGLPGFLALSLVKQDPPLVTGVPGLTLNVALPELFLALGTVDGNGDMVLVTPPPPPGSAGLSLFAQFATFDGAVVDASAGWDVTILP